MPEKSPNGSTEASTLLTCPFSDEATFRQVKKHFQDLDELRQASAASNTEMGKLVASQVALNSTLTGISKSLDNGFELGKKVVQLFGWISIVFIVVVIILAILFIYVTKTQLDYKDVHIRPGGFSGGGSLPEQPGK